VARSLRRLIAKTLGIEVAIMNSNQNKIRYENSVAEIIGRSISKVRYIEIDYQDQLPYWENEYFHNIDFGVELETENGNFFRIKWDSEFFQYEISLNKGTLKDKFSDGIFVWDVTRHAKWIPYINIKIVDVKIYWSWVKVEGKRFDYPQDLEMIFANGEKIYFSASQYFEDRDELFGFSDEVTVIFHEEVAKRYKVGLYSSKKNL
jgi:hypothetical protein